ncbi:uncharacterized protein BYT42DRAFT_563927 [Radiomyces spectabilis]|uniref:uncharacterized protein n=1 Tax=Radiomyces spectabilis TaxID=64574 RepID=UPI002220E97F|nr:uncharacterized protein BYT42DRAFT_563927 [Radiomyces spectabilis]KAI8384876.1 hypothetical protein BYT42DRAFT_563927 [Radiomyces spectabilis]
MIIFWRWTVPELPPKMFTRYNSHPYQLTLQPSFFRSWTTCCDSRLTGMQPKSNCERCNCPRTKKFAEAVAACVEKLPSVPLDQDPNKSELYSRFIEPFLSGLFDDPDQEVYTALDKRNNIGSEAIIQQHAPRLNNYHNRWSQVERSLGYGEAKPATRENDFCADYGRSAQLDKGVALSACARQGKSSQGPA